MIGSRWGSIPHHAPLLCLTFKKQTVMINLIKKADIERRNKVLREVKLSDHVVEKVGEANVIDVEGLLKALRG